MIRDIQRSVLSLVVLTAILCGAYPLVVWAIAQAGWRDRAQGSLVVRDGRTVGSRLIAQPFSGAGWFRPRPSAASYAGDASAASNLGPNSRDLAAAVRERAGAVARADGVALAAVPADLATASASGLDPDVSVAGALVQVDRVARARGLDPAAVRRLVERHVDGPTLGLLGARRVNVLDLNLALAAGEAR